MSSQSVPRHYEECYFEEAEETSRDPDARVSFVELLDDDYTMDCTMSIWYNLDENRTYSHTIEHGAPFNQPTVWCEGIVTSEELVQDYLEEGK